MTNETVRLYAVENVQPAYSIERQVEDSPLVNTPVQFGDDACVGCILVYDDKQGAIEASSGGIIHLEMGKEHYDDIKGGHDDG